MAFRPWFLRKKRSATDRRSGRERRQASLFKPGIGAAARVPEADYEKLANPKPRFLGHGLAPGTLLVSDRRMTPTGPFGDAKKNPDRRSGKERRKPGKKE